MPKTFWDWFGKLAWPWKVLVVLLTWWFVAPLYAWTKSAWPNSVKWLVTGLTSLLFLSTAMATIAPAPARQVSAPFTKKATEPKRKPSPKITYRILETTGSIPFEEEHVQDPNLPKGQTQIRQEGVNGEKTFVYKVKLVNGVEKDRSLQKELISLKPTNRIIADGTKEPPPPPPPAAAAPPPAPAPAPPISPTVYITNTGKRYHQDHGHVGGCHSYLSQSKIAISQNDAIGRGYTPCQCASCSW